MVGLDCVTILYQASDLSLNQPSTAFTNLYHRGQGLGIDLSVGEVVWVIRVDNGGEPYTPYGVAHTVGKVSKRKFSEPPAGIATEPMVADLVGQ